MEQKNTNNMGIGKLGSSEIVFARRFRFEVFSDEYFPTHYVKWAKVNYHKKFIKIKCYDLIDEHGGYHIHKWADKVNMKRAGKWLELRNYDATGVNIITSRFEQLEIIGMESNEFDYNDSGECYTEITLSYKKHNKRLHKYPEYFNNYNYSLTFNNLNGDLIFSTNKVILEERPKIEMEESEINRLNSKFKLPGKFSTLPIKLIGEELKEISDILYGKMNIILKLYDNDKQLEEWILEQCHISKFKPSLYQTELEINYQKINYNVK